MDEALLIDRELPRPWPAAAIGRALSETFGNHPADATARARYCGGILVERAPASAVRALRERLRDIDVHCRVLPADALVAVPRPIHVHALTLGDREIEARLVGGRRLRYPKEAIVALRLAAFEASDSTDSPAPEGPVDRSTRSLLASSPRAGRLAGGPGLSPRGRRLLERLEETEVGDPEFRLTLYRAEPPTLLRVDKEAFDYSCRSPQKTAHSLDNFLLLLDDILTWRAGAWGADVLKSFLEDLDVRPVLHFRREEATRLDRWTLQWLRFDREDRPAEADNAVTGGGR